MFDGINFEEYVQLDPRGEREGVTFVLSRLRNFAEKINKHRDLIKSPLKRLQSHTDALVEYFRVQAKYLLLQE